MAEDEGRGVTDANRQRERLEATVHGTVQGVGFRWFVVRHSSGLGLTGWTANESDGSVRVVAEGPPTVLDRLFQLLHQGPAGASVTAVDATRMPATGEFKSFAIRPAAHRGD
jgi:acylphosphatase